MTILDILSKPRVDCPHARHLSMLSRPDGFAPVRRRTFTLGIKSPRPSVIAEIGQPVFQPLVFGLQHNLPQRNATRNVTRGTLPVQRVLNATNGWIRASAGAHLKLSGGSACPDAESRSGRSVSRSTAPLSPR
jgi:hypothetical protein